MQQAVIKLIVCAAWIAGAWLLRGYVWPRRFFAYGGVLLASLYWGPIGFAKLQQALAFPNEQTAEVPFIGMLVGYIVGPAAAVTLGYWAMRNTWCYVLAQAITVAFFIWVRFGNPNVK